METKIQFFKNRIAECNKIINSDIDCVNVFIARHKKITLQELINKYQIKQQS